ncbi:MAG: biopolymer transporter ExbD [Muribaculaceae bacterium]|nr:biopolymer transporter ExbD [Muribaculaceae bacterium]
MAQIEQSDKGGKKKKGAQKKMAIHVDFTPMVDMNMLLITFFMLCTTMIKSQTLQVVLPSNDPNVDKKDKTEASADNTITMILDTEYEGINPKVDEEGKTMHHIYWYEGTVEDAIAKNDLHVTSFIGNENKTARGIREVLQNRNEEILKEYKALKEKWKNKEITRDEFQELAKKNSSREENKLTVLIKPGPNTTYEGLINALDEMQLAQIQKYAIQSVSHEDSVLIEQTNPAFIKAPIRQIIEPASKAAVPAAQPAQ